MNSNKIIEELVRDVMLLREEVDRLSKLTPVFTILNTNVVFTQITSNQNNYAIGNYDHVYLQTDASRNITGLAGGVSGRRLAITNFGAFNIVLVHLSGLSIAANRIRSTTSADLTLLPNRAVFLHYVTDWRVMMIGA